MAASSKKFAGYVTLEFARTIRISWSSKGCLRISMVCFWNSVSSSKNNTPQCANDISPGLGFFPPPVSPAIEMVWWGCRNGRFETSAVLFDKSPHTLYILDNSICSRFDSGGRMDAIRSDSMVFPAPGGPINRSLGHKIRVNQILHFRSFIYVFQNLD